MKVLNIYEIPLTATATDFDHYYWLQDYGIYVVCYAMSPGAPTRYIKLEDLDFSIARTHLGNKVNTLAELQ